MLECANLQRVDELVYGGQVISPCDADEIDPVSVDSVYLCDRRGFGATRRSPRSPEPQEGVGAFQRVEVDLTAGRGGDETLRRRRIVRSVGATCSRREQSESGEQEPE